MHHALNTLSYTTGKELEKCQRKYQLLYVKQMITEPNPHFSFGRAVGAGFATYVFEGLDAAYLDTFIAYTPYLTTPLKTMGSALRGVRMLAEHWENEGFAENYEPIAKEQSFELKLESGCSYIGHIDLTLAHKYTGTKTVLDVKTTQWNSGDAPPNFQNADQAIIYGAVQKQLSGGNAEPFTRLYFVLKLLRSGIIKPTLIPFKTYPDDVREAWTHVRKLESDLHFAKMANNFVINGESCMAFSKPCPFLDNCKSQHTLTIPDNPAPSLSQEFSAVITAEEFEDFWGIVT